MPVPRSRFHTAIQSPPNRQIRTEIVEPIGGLNKQRPATNLQPGETPFSQNWVMGDRYIEPRSGLSSFGTTGATGVPMTYVNAPDSKRSEFAYVFSSSTFRVYDLTVSAGAFWVPQRTTPAISASTYDYYSVAQAIRPNISDITGPNALYLTNFKNLPMVLSVGTTGLAAVALTEIYSIDSYFRYNVAFDDRMLWFNSGKTSTGTDLSLFHPTRATWSARGNPSDYTAGGFEDINGMVGLGTGAVAERDRLVLLTDNEVWQGRPRRDAYAFDFFNLDKAKGCPAENDRSPKNTEAGTIWLGSGFQFYRLLGSEVRALGDKVREYLKDNMREWRHAFSVYNPTEHLYGFFFSDTTGEYATRALFLRTDTVRPVAEGRDDGIWFPQDFGSLQFSAGGIYGPNTVLISSAGTPYRLLSTQTTDNGTAIDCRWRSHALRAERDILPYEALQECWLEYEYDGTQASTISLFQSTDNGASFTAVASSSLTTGTNYALIPVSAAAGRNQVFEWRLNDGSRPRLARFELTLRGYSGRHSGAL